MEVEFRLRYTGNPWKQLGNEVPMYGIAQVKSAEYCALFVRIWQRVIHGRNPVTNYLHEGEDENETGEARAMDDKSLFIVSRCQLKAV